MSAVDRPNLRPILMSNLMAEFDSGCRNRSYYLSDSDSDSRPTSMTSQSVDEDMNINEVSFAGVVTPDEQRRSSIRKCYSLATTRPNVAADNRALQVQQLHHIVHVSCFSYLHGCQIFLK